MNFDGTLKIFLLYLSCIQKIQLSSRDKRESKLNTIEDVTFDTNQNPFFW